MKLTIFGANGPTGIELCRQALEKGHSVTAAVDVMRVSHHCRRLIITSSGLTVMPPRGRGFIEDYLVLPLLRYVIGRTLYDDMARMETFLAIAWTIMRPGRLKDSPGVSKYRLDENFPAGGEISRQGLAAAMLAELESNAHVYKKMAPSSIPAL